MAEGISAREFARREGVSDTLVRRAIKQGRLKVSADKLLDPEQLGTAWREGNVPGALTSANRPCEQQVRTSPAGVRTPSLVRTPAESAPAALRETELLDQIQSDESLESAAERLIKSGQVPQHDYAEALRRKENYLALLRQLEYEQKTGALVDLETAERVLFEGARAQRDAWLSWPSKVGPLLAADFGLPADKVTAALTEHVHKHIAQLGEPDVQFGAQG